MHHVGPQEIFLLPSPTITVFEGGEIQFACGPFLTVLPAPILEINGTVVDVLSEPRIIFQDFPGDNRTYVYSGVQRAEDGIVLQCFSNDRSLSSNITRLIVYCEFRYHCQMHVFRGSYEVARKMSTLWR